MTLRYMRPDGLVVAVVGKMNSPRSWLKHTCWWCGGVARGLRFGLEKGKFFCSDRHLNECACRRHLPCMFHITYFAA